MNDAVFHRVCAVVAEQLGVSASRVTLDTRLVGDLGVDDLDIVELVMELEDTFDILIPDDDVPSEGSALKRATVRTLVQIVENEPGHRQRQDDEDVDLDKPGYSSGGIPDGYYECDVPPGDGLCSDNQCPCPDVEIPRGTGYLYISQENVELRRQYPDLQECREAMQQKVAELRATVGPNVTGMFRSGPILVCEQGARLRGLNLEVASADARHWWKTGFVPLRVTPQAGREPEGLPLPAKNKNEKKQKNAASSPTARQALPAATADDNYNHTVPLAIGTAGGQFLVFGIVALLSFFGTSNPKPMVAETTPLEQSVAVGVDGTATDGETPEEPQPDLLAAEPGDMTSESGSPASNGASGRSSDDKAGAKTSSDPATDASDPGAEADHVPDAFRPRDPDETATKPQPRPPAQAVPSNRFGYWGQLAEFPLSDRSGAYRKIYPDGRIRPARFSREGIYRFLTFRPKSNVLLAYGNDDHLLRFQETGGERRTVIVAGMPTAVGRGAFSVTGSEFYIGTEAGTLQRWTVATLKFQMSDIPEDKFPFRCAAVAPNNLVFGADGYGAVGIWSGTRPQRQQILAHGSEWVQIAAAPNNQTVACLGRDSIRLLNLQGNRTSFVSGKFNQIGFKPNGFLVAVDHANRSVVTGQDDLSQPTRIELRDVGKSDWTASVLAANGRELAVGMSNGNIKFLDLDTGELLDTLRGHQGEVTGLAFSADALRLASMSTDRTIRLWGPGGVEAEVSPLRTWTDASGQHKTEARFVEIDGKGFAVLARKDGSQFRIDIKRLSTEDREWIGQGETANIKFP